MFMSNVFLTPTFYFLAYIDWEPGFNAAPNCQLLVFALQLQYFMTIITKRSILDVTAVLDPPLIWSLSIITDANLVPLCLSGNMRF